MAFNSRSLPVSITCDGQSLNDNPALPGTGYAFELQTQLDMPVQHAYIGGMDWVNLKPSQYSRVFPYANVARRSIYHMMGGTTGLTIGLSGATMYTNTQLQAQAARDAGYDFVVVVTCSSGVGITGAGFEANRLAYNAALIADSLNKFDLTIDICPTPGVNLALHSTPSFQDGTHWSVLGQQQALAIAVPQLRAFVP